VQVRDDFLKLRSMVVGDAGEEDGGTWPN